MAVTATLLSACGSELHSTTPPAEHRAAATTCTSTRSTVDWSAQQAIDQQMGWGPIECRSDADCTAAADGRCARKGDGYYTCTYHECAQDSDCPSGAQVCGCGLGDLQANVCLQGDCRTDADCGAGVYCSPTSVMCDREFGPAATEYRCTQPQDECLADTDCASCASGQTCSHPGWCAWDASQGHRVCAYRQCTN